MFLSMDSVGQKIVEAKKEKGKTDIEDVDLMSNKPNHPVNPIVMTILKDPSESWEGKLHCSCGFERNSSN